MPDILEQTFAAVGDTLGDRLDLRPLHPAYDARFADGTRLAVHSEPDAMYAEVRRFAGAAERSADSGRSRRRSRRCCATNGCGGCSVSSRCTRAWRRSARWRCTR
ncbi:phytoene dehydrogenase--like protein [Mycobacteroides abscessus subsp. abscessus]|nr:phytoene dehydrogenase--like protein [Mycobacteroides abscessus subsp. abscessus]